MRGKLYGSDFSLTVSLSITQRLISACGLVPIPPPPQNVPLFRFGFNSSNLI